MRMPKGGNSGEHLEVFCGALKLLGGCPDYLGAVGACEA